MANRWLIVSCLILMWPVLGQRKITNSITPAHKQVSKTNCYLVPPVGFVYASEFSGFTNHSLSADLIFHIIELPLEVVHQQMSARELSGQGLKFSNEEKISINRSTGYLIRASFLRAGAKWLRYTLILHGEANQPKSTYVIQGNFPDDKKLSSAIENSMLSFVFSVTSEQPLVEPFTIQYLKFGFKWKESASQGNTYEARDAFGNVVTLRVSMVRISNKSTEKDLILYDKIKQLPYAFTKLGGQGIEEVTIDGLAGLHASIKAIRDDDSQDYVYMLMLINGEAYYVFTATSGHEKALEGAKNALQTFKLK